MREAVKVTNYRLLPDDRIEVEWVRSLPGHVNQFLLIIDAGCEPDDRAVRIGILNAAWFEHEAGCVLVSRGDLVVTAFRRQRISAGRRESAGGVN